MKKDNYIGIAKLIEKTNNGEKVLEKITEGTHAETIDDAKKTIRWKFQAKHNITFGEVTELSDENRSVRWELEDISIVREIKVNKEFKEKVIAKLERLKNDYNISDREIEKACKEYGIDSASYSAYYRLLNNDNTLTYKTIRRVEKSIDKLSAILMGNKEESIGETMELTLPLEQKEENKDLYNKFKSELCKITELSKLISEDNMIACMKDLMEKYINEYTQEMRNICNIEIEKVRGQA